MERTSKAWIQLIQGSGSTFAFHAKSVKPNASTSTICHHNKLCKRFATKNKIDRRSLPLSLDPASSILYEMRRIEFSLSKARLFHQM